MLMLGEVLSLGSAIAWAAAVVLYKRSDEVHPETMNLFKNVVGVLLIGLTLVLMGEGIDVDRSTEDWARLVLSGVIGIAIADTLAFAALRRLGAGLMAVVETSYAPSMVLMSVVFLGDALGWTFVLGGTLVAGGVFVASYAPTRDRPAGRDPVGRYIGIGVAGIVLMAAGIVLAKPALDRGGVVEVTFIRLVAGTLAQLIAILPRRAARQRLSIFKPQRVWRTLVPGSFFGGFLAMVFWIGGMKYTTVSVAAILGQMATIFTLIFARMFLAEPLTRNRVIGAAAAAAGAALLLA